MQSLTTGGKILVFLFVLFAVVGFIDYFFYVQQVRHLLSGLGFSLLAYGGLMNGFSGARPRHPTGRYASIIGALILMVSIALRFLQ